MTEKAAQAARSRWTVSRALSVAWASRFSMSRQRSRHVVLICSQHPFLPKPRKIAVHRSARRILSGQHAPGAATAHHLKNAIEHGLHIDSSWPTDRLARRDQWRKNRPLLVCEIAGIDFHRRPPFLDQLTPVFSPCPTYSTIVHPPSSG